MPSGVYIRTEEEIWRIRELGKKPKTQKQLKTSRENARKLGKRFGPKNIKRLHMLPRTSTQIESIRKVGLSMTANTIVKHHNDLCHGALRPNDVIYITNSEHGRLHCTLQNGYIGKNKGRFK